MDALDETGPKRATNLSINRALLRAARERKIDLSATLEQALRERLRRESHADWLEENARAFEKYDSVVTERGVFRDHFSRF